MKRIVLLWLTLALPVLAQVPATAQTAAPEKLAKRATFVDASKLVILTLVAPPPANDSAQTKAELAELQRLQAARTPAQEKQAQEDETETVFAVVGGSLGPAFTAEKLPITAAFFGRVLADESLIVNPAKDVWARPRPPVLDVTLKTCVKLTASNAYPSGHATIAYLTAIVLSEMIPERRGEMFGDANRFAESRLICGVHYRSDIEASKTVGALIAFQIRGNPIFQKEFSAAKSEVRSALGLSE